MYSRALPYIIKPSISNNTFVHLYIGASHALRHGHHRNLVQLKPARQTQPNQSNLVPIITRAGTNPIASMTEPFSNIRIEDVEDAEELRRLLREEQRLRRQAEQLAKE